MGEVVAVFIAIMYRHIEGFSDFVLSCRFML